MNLVADHLALPNRRDESCWIICGGMIRSGSTLQYQIASELIERTGTGVRTTYISPAQHGEVLALKPAHGGMSTFKTHELTDAVRDAIADLGGVVLYCYRDVRDVVASHQRKSQARLAPNEVQCLVRSLMATDASWRGLPNAYSVSYEQMTTDLNAEVGRVAKFLNVECPTWLSSFIAKSLAYDQQARRIIAVADNAWVKADELNVYDSASLLHKNHLQSGQIGRFSNELSPDQIVAIEAVAGEWLMANGYMGGIADGPPVASL